MELKVGMYAYSKHSRDYGIGKIVKIHTNGFSHQEVEIQYKDIKISTRYDYVIGSHNPIDLIEEGDYVNGYEVIEKPYYYHDVCFVSVNSRESWGWGIGEMPMNEIKSIVTKEQFEAMKYIIKK